MGMKLGKRWLYALWVAFTLVWSQGHVDLSAGVVTPPHAQWVDSTVSPLPCAFTLQDFDDKEGSGATYANAFPLFIEPAKTLVSAPVILSQVINVDLSTGISAVKFAWQPTRGPPADA